MTERDNKERKMSEVRLFGMTIELPETMAAAEESGGAISARCDASGEDGSDQEPPCSSDSMLEDGGLNGHAEEEESRESLSSPKQDHAKDEDRTEELKDSRDSRAITRDRNAPSETEAGSEKMTKNEDDQNEMSNSQDKTLKKPDKLLPCPRCNSMDTKFCYFNNYNVNQPRHFCKNCQRYWTAGGTMRNVPVGAGRRKNKNSIPQFRHLAAPEARVDGYHRAALNPNGTVLTFGSDSPLCESMASVLNIVDKTNCNGSRNRFHRPEEVEISDRSKESGDDSSTTASSSKDEVGRKNGLPEMMPNCHPFPQQVPCYPGGPWPYPWRPVQWNSAVSPPSFPVPFYAAAPPPYWACAVPSAWVMPRAPPLSSGPNSPTLGKHSRDENMPKPGNAEEGAPKESNLEKNLWFPKTLRIDDPGEAAKSSIWKTLGIKDKRVEGVGGGGGLFKAFQAQSKGDEKSHVLETSTVLQANPAAFSRSLSFHENS